MCCEKNIGRYEDYITCNQESDHNYHLKCIDMSIDDYGRMREDGTLQNWKCAECDRDITSKSINEEISQVSDLNQLKQFITIKLEAVVKDITSTIINSMQKEISKLITENSDLRREVEKLRQTGNTASSTSIHQNQNAEPMEENRKLHERREAVIVQSNNTSIINKDQNEGLPLQHQPIPYKAMLTRETSTSNSQGLVEQNTKTEDGFKEVISRKKQRRLSTVNGASTNTNLKGACKYRHYHLYRLNPETTEADIVKHVKMTNNTDVKCEKLISKHPDEYSSFKISVIEGQHEFMENADTWPQGARINRFLFRISTKTKQKV